MKCCLGGQIYVLINDESGELVMVVVDQIRSSNFAVGESESLWVSN